MEALGHSCSFWRGEKVLELLRDFDSVSGAPLKVRRDKALLDFTQDIT